MAVQRIVIQCKVCSSKTLLRLQVGYIENVPLSIGCIGCGVALRGEYLIDNQNVSTDIKLDNAIVVDHAERFQEDQEIECSGEFPTRRFSKDVGIARMTPFMNATSFMEHEDLVEFSGKLREFQNEWKSKGKVVQDAFALYKNGKYVFMDNLLADACGFARSSEDLARLISFYNVAVINLPVLLSNEAHSKKLKFAKAFIRRCEEGTSKADLDKCIFEINKIWSREQLINSGLELMFRIMGRFQSYVPAICVDYAGGSSSPYLEKGQYFITSFDFSDNKQNFVDMYEWLSKFLVYLVGLENLLERNDFAAMRSSKASKDLGIHTLWDFSRLDHGRKKEITVDYSFSGNFHSTFGQNGQLRNAIGHYKLDINPVEQLVSYFPYKDPKKQEKAKSIHLIKFAYLSYTSFQCLHQAMHILCLLDLHSKDNSSAPVAPKV